MIVVTLLIAVCYHFNFKDYDYHNHYYFSIINTNITNLLIYCCQYHFIITIKIMIMNKII